MKKNMLCYLNSLCDLIYGRVLLRDKSVGIKNEPTAQSVDPGNTTTCIMLEIELELLH